AYQYCGNEPLQWVDPTGLAGKAVAIAIAIGVIVGSVIIESIDSDYPNTRVTTTTTMIVKGELSRKRSSRPRRLQEWEEAYYPLTFLWMTFLASLKESLEEGSREDRSESQPDSVRRENETLHLSCRELSRE
ncbi:MAG: hypothetical protein ABIN58_03350, partial [candidate division WOR-3 bacterium]